MQYTIPTAIYYIEMWANFERKCQHKIIYFIHFLAPEMLMAMNVQIYEQWIYKINFVIASVLEKYICVRSRKVANKIVWNVYYKCFVEFLFLIFSVFVFSCHFRFLFHFVSYSYQFWFCVWTKYATNSLYSQQFQAEIQLWASIELAFACNKIVQMECIHIISIYSYA